MLTPESPGNRAGAAVVQRPQRPGLKGGGFRSEALVMQEWRGLFAGVAQLVILVLPFVGLTLVVFSAFPVGSPTHEGLIGRWASSTEPLEVDGGLVVLDLEPDGACELRVCGDDLLGRCVRGRYEVVMGHLVVQFPSHRMVWSLAEEGRELHHRTKHGRAYRLLRS